MRTEIITSMIEAATALHELFVEASTPPFEKHSVFALNELIWQVSTDRYLAALSRLNELKNEYAGNILAAPEPARVKDYYRQQVKRCKELCPYTDSKSELEPAIEKLAERCKGKEGYKPIADSEDKQEYLRRAKIRQHDFASHTAALAAWWQSIEPSRRLERLSAYPQANTERAQEYFAIAIDKGFMREMSTGYEWLKPERGTRGNKAALAYFIGKVYKKENYTPDKELEALFGYKRLGDAASKSQTPQASIIDKEIFGDE